MTAPVLLVVGFVVATSWGQDQIRRLSDQARRRGICLVGADTIGNLSRARPSEFGLVDKVVALDVHDAGACGAWAAGRHGIDAVLTISELAVYPAAVIAQELGLPGNAPQAVHRVRNKDLCRDRLRAAGFRQPRIALCRSEQDAARFMAQTGPGPWVVKPRDGMASIGVSLLDGPAGLPAALERFGGPPPAFGSLPRTGSFLVEDYVEGEEFSAEGVVRSGVPQVLSLTRKQVGPGFVETGHRAPAGLAVGTAAEAAAAVSGALTEIGITRGIFHVEFWVTSSGVVLGELHDRPGGDYLHALVEHRRPGLELYGTVLDDLLGLPPAPVPAATGAAAASFLLIPPGRLTAVHGWDKLTGHPAVLAADLWAAPGDVIEPVTDSFGRHGVFVVGADTGDEADRLVRDLADAVTFEVS
ncbi:MAG TPA: ATP-grasp domain-containing protein [Streptosporangiaceae bacterium]